MKDLSANERLLIGVCGLAALLGIVVGYAQPSVGTSILKDFAVFVGGGGIAFALAAAGARATATERVRSLSNRSVQRLGLAASHARNVSAELREHSASDDDGSLLLIASKLDNLAEEAEVSIGDLEEMAGARIRLDPLVADALQRIEEAVNEALPGETEGTKSKVLSAIAEPLRRLEAQVASVNTRAPLLAARHLCSQCGSPLTTVLGEAAGSTAHSTCVACGSQLTVHRLADGSVMTKTSAPRIKINCPGCGSDMQVKVKPTDTGIVVRNCFQCDERIFVNVLSGAIDHSEKQTPLHTTYRHDGEKVVVTCPNCMNVMRLMPRADGNGGIKLSCGRCTNLVAATPA